MLKCGGSVPDAVQIGSIPQAKFTHEDGTGLRLQAFLKVVDDAGRLACLRLDGYDGWTLPGETLRLNEAPHEAAARVASSWFATPLAPKLVDVFSYPATGPDDPRWYLLFIYEAKAPAGLKATPDTLEVRFAKPGEAPGPWAMSHADVWAKIR